MRLIGNKDGFEVWFDCTKQMYTVFKDGKFLINNKYKFSDVKSYLN